MEAAAEYLRRVGELPATGLVSEEDVKNKVVLPVLRALGYEDNDFNYERGTGRGQVDVVVERFPTGIVVEAKAPRTRLEGYLDQLETYVSTNTVRTELRLQSSLMENRSISTASLEP